MCMYMDLRGLTQIKWNGMELLLPPLSPLTLNQQGTDELRVCAHKQRNYCYYYYFNPAFRGCQNPINGLLL